MSEPDSELNTELIQCSDDGWSPWSIVCNHLVYGTSSSWIPVPSRSLSTEYDWLCPECLALMEAGKAGSNLNNLAAICIHCVRRLRRERDCNFSEE